MSDQTDQEECDGVFVSVFDDFAAQPRETGKLAEPLANSVLRYTLGQLKPLQHSETPIVQELEQLTASNGIAKELMDIARPEADIPAPMSGSMENPQNAEADLHPSRMEMGIEAYAPLDDHSLVYMTDEQLRLQGWWDPTSTNLSQPLFSYEDLFGFDTNL